jgi:hypothetical protein
MRFCTITAVYGDYDEASRAVGDLEAAGILHANLKVHQHREGAGANSRAMEDILRETPLEESKEHRAHFYVETLRRGGCVIVVRAEERQQAAINEVLARRGRARRLALRSTD